MCVCVYVCVCVCVCAFLCVVVYVYVYTNLRMFECVIECSTMQHHMFTLLPFPGCVANQHASNGTAARTSS